jgi:hypothetical protein
VAAAARSSGRLMGGGGFLTVRMGRVKGLLRQLWMAGHTLLRLRGAGGVAAAARSSGRLMGGGGISDGADGSGEGGLLRRLKLRARGTDGVQGRWSDGADELPGTSLRRWGWLLRLGQGLLLRGRLCLRRWLRRRRHVGCSRVVRHIKCDSPGKAGEV